MMKMINLTDDGDSPIKLAGILTKGKYQTPNHILAINSLLKKISNAELKRLIVNMPPRHGKSELISKFFPIWYIAKNPEHRIILTTYSSAFASTWGRKIKEILIEFGSELKLELDKNYKSNSLIKVSNGSSIQCSGAGAAITGMGADLIIIDDPIKNSADSHSFKIREKIMDWFQSTVFTRLEPDGRIIIIMTRWHEEDLVGSLLADASLNDWICLSLPAIALENDLLGRKVGEALWNDRFSWKKLNEIKKQIGSYWFEALYQQSPFSKDDKLFKKENFHYCSYETAFVQLFSNDRKLIDIRELSCYFTVDLAISTKDSADYTVLLVFDVGLNNDILIKDILRVKLKPSEHLDFIRNQYEKYKPILIGIESVQYQVSLIQQALNSMMPVKELKPNKDKISRALHIAALLESGKVFFRKDAEWLYDFENELLKFPKGLHDDQVDALAYIPTLIEMRSNSLPTSKIINNKLFK